VKACKNLQTALSDHHDFYAPIFFATFLSVVGCQRPRTAMAFKTNAVFLNGMIDQIDSHGFGTIAR
jgi:hypothetical protein